MNRINNATSLKQTHYEEDYLSDGERFHKESIYNLEKKLSEQPKSSQSLYDWISNHHELAFIYEQRGELLMAQKCLLIPHQSMLYMALNDNDDKEWKRIAIKALNLTLPRLMKFAEIYPPCAHCMEKLKSQLALIESNNKMHH